MGTATVMAEAGPEAASGVEGVLEHAAEFFERNLWESDSCRAARARLERSGLREQILRDFQVGYAPIGQKEMLSHLGALGYSADELTAAGIATRSARRHVHAHFCSRVMFPIRDRAGRILGFAGMATHLGPSWPLWVVSPDRGLYRRAEAVFGLDRAAGAITRSGTVRLAPDCFEALKAHQDGEAQTVAVHTSSVTPEQLEILAHGVPGGVDDIEIVSAEKEPAKA
jgi:DNA primase